MKLAAAGLLALLLAGCWQTAAPLPPPLPPAVVSTWPEDRAVAIPASARVRFTFDSEMDSRTLAGAVRIQVGDGRGGTTLLSPDGAAYDAELKSLFLQLTMPAGGEVAVTVGTQARALNGEPLAEPVTVRFLVETDPRAWWRHETAPAVLGRGCDGRLLFRGRPVPSAAGTLTTPAGVFNCLCRRADDEDSGWIRMDDPPRQLADGGSPVGVAELTGGRYPATVAGRRAGTPLTWVHLSDNSGGWWLDPEQLLLAR